MALLQFTEEHLIFRKTVSDFVAKEIRPHAEKWEAEGKTPRSLWKKCGELGLLGISYPEEFGGLDAEFTYNYIYAEELGKCGTPGVAVGLTVHSDMATPALANHGSQKLKEEFLKPAIKGEMISCVAVTEPGCGSDVAAIQTRAQSKGDKLILNGQKTYISNGSQADFAVVLARTNDTPGHKGMSLIVVPTQTKGFSAGKILKKVCHLSSDTAEISFENVEVPKANIIGEEGKGFIYQMEQFQHERLIASATALGSIKRAYEITKKYVHERQAFGAPLSEMQVTRHKIAQMAAEIEMLESFTHRCVALANAKLNYTKEVSMLKLMAAQLQTKITEECVQLHGGYGLMMEYEISRYFRDSKLLSIAAGTNEIMKEIIARTELA